jgi:hypothetical protein
VIGVDNENGIGPNAAVDAGAADNDDDDDDDDDDDGMAGAVILIGNNEPVEIAGECVTVMALIDANSETGVPPFAVIL